LGVPKSLVITIRLEIDIHEVGSMAYTAEISRANPSAFVFLLDQSGSMADSIGSGEVRRKADVVADALNRLLSELAIKCAKEEGVRDYFHVAVVGYGSSVGSAFGGALSGRDLVPLSEVASVPARLEERTKKVDDGAGGLVEQSVKFPIWVEPITNGGTPMTQALQLAQGLVQGFVANHPGCFPPVVLNLTDGEATDGDPRSAAEAVRQVSSADGQVLLFNLHVSSSGGEPVTFPDSDARLADTYAKQLFSMSSTLPSHMRTFARDRGYEVSDGTRGFVYNADIASVVQFLEIGTRATDLR
jgi:hypothetical protein